MKALLVNPYYPPTFWSFERVTKMLGKRAVVPPLGLITLAALLPSDWEFRLLDLAAEDGTEDVWQSCDLVLITGMHVQSAGILDAIRMGKQAGKTVVVGGPWAFHAPKAALDAGADIVVLGEGENTVPLLLNALESKVTGAIIEATVGVDLKESPPPRFDLLNRSLYLNAAVQFTRGCPFKCEFCDITLMLGRAVRSKTPDRYLPSCRTSLTWDGGHMKAATMAMKT
jgi:radical SAM superfamily enzyme YgiQ (UPF0313 family)